MSKNILEALGKIDVALGGNDNDAVNVIDALDQISQGAGSLKTSVDNINGVQMRICGTGEYDAETGIPTIENPEEGVFYLTPAGQQDNNIFNEYYYKDGQWEMFGGASINVNDLFDLSDRMAKGVNDNGTIVYGAIIEGTLSGSYKNKASGINSHAEGRGTTASGHMSHAEGGGTTASGDNSHAEGGGATASGTQSHAEGSSTTASGSNSHAEGQGGTFTINNVSYTSEAKGIADHTEGYQTRTESGQPGNHAEGFQTAATGGASHAEGFLTIASGSQSHAEGSYTIASGNGAHTEGNNTTASGDYSHVEGSYTIASGALSHAEGFDTIASGNYSHAEGNSTTANHRSQHVFGEYNIEDPSSGLAINKGTYIEIVGNGTMKNARSNARTLDWFGNETLSGSLSLVSSLTLGKGTADEVTITAAQLKSLIALLNKNNN